MEEIVNEERELRSRRVVLLGHPPVDHRPLLDELQREREADMACESDFEPYPLRSNSRRITRQTKNGNFTYPVPTRRRGR